MARLPEPGSDDGTWGDVLNGFLEISHNLDGTLRTSALIAAGGVTSISGTSPSSGAINLTTANLSDMAITSPSDSQVLTYSGNKWVNQTPASALGLDTTGSDIQPLGTQAAGNSGQAADAKHVHPMPRLDQVLNPTVGVSLGGQKITNVANGSAGSDAAAFGQIPTSLPPSGNACGDLTGSYPNPNLANTTNVQEIVNTIVDANSAVSTYDAGNVWESPASIDICRAYGVAPGDDVTSAIQDALNTLANSGTGGEVVISIPGSYTVNGSLLSATVLGYTYHGQILIPAVSSSDTTSLALSIRGCVPPMGGGEGRPSGGGVTLVSNATSGWVFDCIPANTAYSSPNPWTNVMLTFENLIIELPNNPQCGAINALCALQLRGRDLYVQTAYWTTGGSQPTLTGTNEAIVIPGYESEGMNVFDRCEIRNVAIAFRFAEHTLLNWVGVYYANIVFNCVTTNNGHGLFLNKLDIGNCLIIFNATTDISSNPVKVYGTIDYEGIVQNMTAFVSQPNPGSSNGSFIGSVKVHSVTSGSFPLSLGTNGSTAILGRLEIVNLSFGDQSWKNIHPQDSFVRTYSPMASGTPGLSYPSFHPWGVIAGSFTITSGTGMTSTYTGTAIALLPAKNNGVSRLVEATFVLPASGFNACLVTSWCRVASGSNGTNWIGAHIHGSGSIDLVTGVSASITTLVTGSGFTSGGSTVTVGVEVICSPTGIPQWVALYVNGVQKLTYGLSASQQSALNVGINITPPYTVGGLTSVWDGLMWIADEATAVTWFSAQDAAAPLGSVASGTATLSAGTVAVANTEITSSSIIRLNRQTAGGTLGQLSVALTAGTSFTINSSSSTETSTVYYEVVSY